MTKTFEAIAAEVDANNPPMLDSNGNLISLPEHMRQYLIGQAMLRDDKPTPARTAAPAAVPKSSTAGVPRHEDPAVAELLAAIDRSVYGEATTAARPTRRSTATVQPETADGPSFWSHIKDLGSVVMTLGRHKQDLRHGAGLGGVLVAAVATEEAARHTIQGVLSSSYETLINHELPTAGAFATAAIFAGVTAMAFLNRGMQASESAGQPVYVGLDEILQTDTTRP